MVVLGLLLPMAAMFGGLPKSVFASTSMRIYWSLDPSHLYTVGIDKISTTGVGSGYGQVFEYPGSTFHNNPTLPNPLPIDSATTLGQVRMEFYNRCHLLAAGDYQHCTSGTYKYSMAEGDTGVVARITPRASVDLGHVLFPTDTQANAARMNATFVSRTAIADGTISVSMFQLTGQPTTSTGQPLDAFGTGANTGASFRSGPMWNGRYITFISDKRNPAVPRNVVGSIELRGATNVTLDLDAVCFGIDECQSTSATPPVPGGFHPLAPARIVDTVHKVGITAPVRPGDGRLGDPNPVNRLNERLDHEFRVTTVAGIPRVGVAAVLVNVTAFGGSQPGSLVLVPKPPRANSLFDDQGSFRALPTAASQLYWRPGDSVTAQVLVRVGSGGRIRIVNRSSAATHVTIDVVGWFDEAQPGQDGAALTAVAPVRSFDTRSGTGTTATMFGVREVRTMSFGKAVPSTAIAAVANIGISPSVKMSGLVAWPTGTTRPLFTTVAAAPPQTRSNMVTVRVSNNGAWNIANGGALSHINVDLQGFFMPTNGDHGQVTTIDPVNVGTSTIAANGAVRFFLRGKPGMPANGVAAVYVNVSVAAAPKAGVVSVGNTTTATIAAGLRYVAGREVANLVLARVAPDGSIVVRNTGAGAGRVSVDLVAIVAA
ncbi:MAG: hypothetical protein WCI22_01735 [Actinomycetota bacterium]